MGIDLRKDKKVMYAILTNGVEIEINSDVKYRFNNNWASLGKLDSIQEYFKDFTFLGIFDGETLVTLIPKASILYFTYTTSTDDYYGNIDDIEQ